MKEYVAEFTTESGKKYRYPCNLLGEPVSKESYYTPLEQGDHVVYVSTEKAYDALVLKIYEDGNVIDLVYVEVNKEKRSVGTRVAERVRFKEKHNPPYWWIPDSLRKFWG